MLSSPPRAFAAATSRSAAASRIAVGLEERRRDLVLGEHVGEAVRAEEDEVARLRRNREDVDLDRALGADRPGDRRALWMPLGLLGREDAALDELRDERVVGRDLLEDVAAQPIGARVADVAEHDLGVAQRRRARP